MYNDVVEENVKSPINDAARVLVAAHHSAGHSDIPTVVQHFVLV